MNRLHSEQIFHDEQARNRALTFSADPHRFIFSDPQYLDHETWIRPAFAQLGNVRGKNILDFGCGHGMASVVLARQGAHVTAFDLSLDYLREARTRAKVNQVDVQFLLANGEHLPFADESFDGIWGNAILHHLDLHQAGRELHRILKPGGKAVFCEPWGGNPILHWARKYLPYPGKQRTVDELPLRSAEVRILEGIFPKVHLQGFQLLAMIRRVIEQPIVVGSLERWDNILLGRWPALERWCRYMVVTLER